MYPYFNLKVLDILGVFPAMLDRGLPGITLLPVPRGPVGAYRAGQGGRTCLLSCFPGCGCSLQVLHSAIVFQTLLGGLILRICRQISLIRKSTIFLLLLLKLGRFMVSMLVLTPTVSLPPPTTFPSAILLQTFSPILTIVYPCPPPV